MSDAGYLSDVPTHHSTPPSEVSQDLVASTKILENHFKEKFLSLRNAYEQRIKQLHEVIMKLYHNISQDEVLQQMKQDPTSSLFIPTHFQELFHQHLTDEREQYLHQTLQKNYLLETEINRLKKINIDLTEELKLVKEERVKEEQQYQKKMTLYKQSLKEKTEECNALQSELKERTYLIQQLENSFEQSSKELALIEGIDQQEQQLRQELSQQLNSTKHQKDVLQQELFDLKSNHRILQDSLQRHQQILEEKQRHEEEQRKKLSTVMIQLETLLEQEMNESNQAISSANDKVKAFRARMMKELQREKRLTSALQEELNTSKQMKDEHQREVRHVTEENRNLRQQLLQGEQKLATLQTELTSSREKLQHIKMSQHELEMAHKLLQQKYEDCVRHQERGLEEMRVRTENDVRRKCEEEQRHLQQKARIMQLQNENNLQSLNQQMRHSYTFGTALKSDSDIIVNNQFHDVSDELSFRQLISTLQQEKIALQQQLAYQEQHVQREFERQSEERIATLHRQWQEETQGQVASLKALLTEAASNIEKLKQMMSEKKIVIQMQKDRIEQLRDQLTHAAQENLSLHHSLATAQQYSSHLPQNTPSHHQIQTPNRSASMTDRTTKLYSPHYLPQEEHYTDTSTVVTPSTSHHHLSQHRLTHPHYIHYNESDVMEVTDTSYRGEEGRENIAPNLEVASHHTKRSSNSPSPSVSSSKQKQSTAHPLHTTATASISSIKSTVTRASTAAPPSVQSRAQSVSHSRIGGGSGNRSVVSFTAESSLPLPPPPPPSITSSPSVKPNHTDASKGTNSSQTAPSSQLLTSALEEARVTKLLNIQLQQDKEVLQAQLLDLLQQLQNQPPQHTASQQIQSASLLPHFEEKGVQVETMAEEEDEVVDDLTFSTFQHILPSTSLPPQQVEERAEVVMLDGATQVEWTDRRLSSVGVNTMPQAQLIDLQDRCEQLLLTVRSLEEKLLYEKKLTALAKQEVEEMKENYLTSAQRVKELKSVLMKIQQRYSLTCQQLHTNLAQLRSQVTSFSTVFCEEEKQSSVDAISLQLKVLLQLHKQRYDEDLKKQQKQFLTVYNKEKEELERRYLSQIQQQQSSQKREIETLHYQLAKQQQTTSPTPSTTPFPNPTSTATVTELVEAFESTLRGTLQALLDQSVIAKDTSDKICAMAKDHHEPSFAAMTSARATIGEEVDKFIFALLNKKYFEGPESLPPSLIEDVTGIAIPPSSLTTAGKQPLASPASSLSSSYFPKNNQVGVPPSSTTSSFSSSTPLLNNASKK